MNKALKELRAKSMILYHDYRSGKFILEEYLEQIKPLDDAIDELELQALNSHLQDTPASEISSL